MNSCRFLPLLSVVGLPSLDMGSPHAPPFAQAAARLSEILRISASMAAISAVSSSESIVSAGRAEMNAPPPPTGTAAVPTEPGLEMSRGSVDREAKQTSGLRVGE
mmetsp:Transcript_23299/g.73052  ORF Transcript_23299/g.73052 Transcript_23299/m.73052 type:complete len:105 (-) Transcript_23299:141-455(-)|eukprot:scaffold9124_cov101-Isochrysis_galbana.AAC.8